MKESILLFHITDRKMKTAITAALLPLKIRVKSVTPAEYHKKLGILAGTLPDETQTDEAACSPEELSDSMMILCGIEGARLNQVLSALKGKKVRLPYKAVLTPSNQSWTPEECLAELKKEHEAMLAGGSLHEQVDPVTQQNIQGNPAKPQGAAGEQMLDRMNQSHYEMTGWGLSHLQLNPDDSLLDIGCGGGATLHRLEMQLPDGKLTGIDYSSVSVAKSISFNQAAVDKGKMSVLEASVESLPFADQTFNKIVTVESFYFWPNHQENLKEVYRVLKEDGQFLLISEIYEHDGLSESIRKNIELYHLFVPDPTGYESLFKNAGFRDIQYFIHETEGWFCIFGKH